MAWLFPHYLWAFLAVPLVVGLFLWASWQRRKALRLFGEEQSVARLAASINLRTRRWKAAFTVAGVFFLCLALAGPRLGTKLREVKREGVDLIIALDVSLSMEAEDVPPSRLERAKNEIKKILSELHGDRVGLVLFAGDAFIQCPLTTDYGAVRLFLDIAAPSMIPTPGTNFEAAVETAVRAFENSTNPSSDVSNTRTILIVSDGENHVGDIGTILETAREAKITVFTAGIGETSGSPIPIYSGGQLTGYKKDREGQIVQTRLEDAALKQLSKNATYFQVSRTTSSLSRFPDALNRLDKKVFETDQFEEYEEQYQWPLALGLVFLCVGLLLDERRR